MSTPYELEASFHPEEIAPQQEGLYRTQLQAISELVLKGSGASLGVGSSVSQSYLQVPGGMRKYMSSFMWPGSAEDDTTNFAVLPSRDFSHTYFGITAPATPTGDKMWVEGVDLHPTGSHYGRALLSYDTLTDPDVRIPMAVGAFVGSIKTHRNNRNPYEADTSPRVSMMPDTHQRLGSALLSFWNTLEVPRAIERTGSRAAFDLARQVIGHGIHHANATGQLKCRFDSLVELKGPRNIPSGFVGKDKRTNSLTAVARNHLVYPERIDYIQIPLSYTDDDAVVSHYAITPYSIGARFCVVPSEKIANQGAAELVAAIKTNKRRLEVLDADGTSDVIRQLYDELGGFVTALHAPTPLE